MRTLLLTIITLACCNVAFAAGRQPCDRGAGGMPTAMLRGALSVKTALSVKANDPAELGLRWNLAI